MVKLLHLLLKNYQKKKTLFVHGKFKVYHSKKLKLKLMYQYNWYLCYCHFCVQISLLLGICKSHKKIITYRYIRPNCSLFFKIFKFIYECDGLHSWKIFQLDCIYHFFVTFVTLREPQTQIWSTLNWMRPSPQCEK